jgi:wyosine [tRNA(Phe)-imidazoG37] synthetase (radical SAM superfamily)
MTKSHLPAAHEPGPAAKEDRKARNGFGRDNHAPSFPMGSPYDFLSNRFVYVVVSARARGLAVGVDLSPTKECNFNCVYCEINRQEPPTEKGLDVEVMAAEFERTLQYVHSNRLHEHPRLGSLPRELLQMRHVTVSGRGEPTRCPNFVEAIQAVVHVRALGRTPFFKLVLITNGTGLDLPNVQAGLKFFTPNDEIWVKLDAGTQAFMNLINRPKPPLEKVLANLQTLGRQRPIVIQSLFISLDGEDPSDGEIEQYARRLRELKLGGAQISLVQVYSATRPTNGPGCRHLPLKTLSRIAQMVRCATGLPVEVF